MSLYTLAKDLINEHGSAAIRLERVELLRDGIKTLQDSHDRLEKSNAKLLEQVTELVKEARTEREKREQVERELDDLRRQQSQFVRHRGVLFLVEGGEVEGTVYCPKCEAPMDSVDGFFPYECHCKYRAAFVRGELKGVIEEVRAKLVKG